MKDTSAMTCICSAMCKSTPTHKGIAARRFVLSASGLLALLALVGT